MTSTIKVDNIENQCGGAVVTKCGATTTISGSVVKADDIQAADGGNIINQCGTTITLGASGDTINLASGASQSGFGRTGTVDWDTTAKTASFTAVSGEGYFCNTTSSAFTATLPAGSAGAIVSFADYAATWQTNNLTVSPNGTDKIGSVNVDVILNTEGQSVTFVYVDSTQGWVNVQDSTSNERGRAFITATGGTITTCGDFKIQTFCVSQASSVPPENVVSYLVVAGGGGGGSGGGTSGGSGAGGAGGGAGGYRENKNPADTYTASPLEGATDISITATAFPITVGSGGAGSSGGGVSNPGNNSIFSTITSAGGGGGGVRQACVPSRQDGQPGGSGGGGTVNIPGKGAGNTPPVSPPQGRPGGAPVGPNFAGGGGGGAINDGGDASAGPPAPGGQGGNGGGGATTSINASPVARSGGGGGGAGGDVPNGTNPGGAGGSGGGGAGGQTGVAGSNGTANTGGGGGGGGSNPGKAGAAGGSGIVIIRYKFQ